MSVHKGIITLKRERSLHQAGFCILQSPLAVLQQQLSLLHPEEQAYYNTLKYDKRKVSYLLGRIAAKRAIGTLLSSDAFHTIAIDSGIFEFPVVKYIPNGNMQVCITHCDETAIALSYPEAHPLGVDIERTDKDNTTAIQDQLTIGELTMATSTSLPLSVACTMIWTIKEGLSKILRTGLTIDLKLLEIKSLKRDNHLYTSEFQHLIQYKAISCVAGKYVCSVVIPRNTTPDLQQFWQDFMTTVAE
jgi:4'-phosphopantetheinyl transferase EntD